MSKEVKRFSPDINGRMREWPDGDYVIWEDYEALLAERDALKGQVETLTGWYANSLDVVNEVAAILPGAHYMDPPDGGDVSVPEQVRRMAKDAERYRWICSASYGAPSHPFIVINDFDSDKASIDAAIDAALQGEQP